MKVKPSGAAVSELDMTPMIDMTFQLIAFFMFTINFQNDLTKETITLPIAETARPVTKALESPLFLNIDRNGVVFLPARELNVRDPRQLADLRSHLMAEVAAERKRSKKGPLKTNVIIRGDGESETGDVQKLMRAAREAGFSKFSLRATLEDQRKKS
jgi:biopolymer transport protein ExbD